MKKSEAIAFLGISRQLIKDYGASDVAITLIKLVEDGLDAWGQDIDSPPEDKAPVPVKKKSYRKFPDQDMAKFTKALVKMRGQGVTNIAMAETMPFSVWKVADLLKRWDNKKPAS